MKQEFKGFPPQALSFFSQLEKNNSKEWFNANRQTYDDCILQPSRQFVEAMGQRLSLLAPHIHADPKVNQSIFRINRDTRFSKNKKPYKTHMAIWLWEGKRPRMECPGFYFHFEPGALIVGAGMYQFAKDQLKTYRLAVADADKGQRLEEIRGELLKDGRYDFSGCTFKRVPRGMDPQHPREELLRHSGVTSGIHTQPPQELHGPEFLDWSFEHCRRFLPLHQWLLENV